MLAFDEVTSLTLIMPGKSSQCLRCSKRMRSDNLKRHSERCKLQPEYKQGASGSGLMHNYRIKENSHLHDLMEAAGPEKSQERPSLGKDDSCDESFLASSTGDELSEDDGNSDESVIRSSDEELHQRIDRKLWRIMSLHSYCNQRCILPTFKYYVKLCRMLKRDDVYKRLTIEWILIKP